MKGKFQWTGTEVKNIFMSHYVYKYVLNDEIIYIGKTSQNLKARLEHHGRKGDNISAANWKDLNIADIYYCKLANSAMADVVESELIRRYKPKYNKAKTSDWDGLSFKEPTWHLYKNDLKEKNSRLVNLIIQQQDTIRDIYEELKNLKEEREKRCIGCKYIIAYDSIMCSNLKSYYLNNGYKTGLTFDEITELYKTGELQEITFVSEAFDIFGECICRKEIYVEKYEKTDCGSLKFRFWRPNELNSYKAGTIYEHPYDLDMKNYAMLKAWKNYGNTRYYIKVQNDDQNTI